MKKIFSLFAIMLLTISAVNSAEYDTSIDADIRKQYNLYELPPLPNVKPSKTSMQENIKHYNTNGTTYTIKGGTTLVLVSKNKISDSSRAGTKISFVSQNQIQTKEGAVIPAGTLFKGVITDSHQPQITGNGGLIKININEIYYNGVMSFIDTKLIQADYKKIFNCNIKGKRRYLKNCKKALRPGIKSYKEMKKISKKMTAYPILNLLSIVPYAAGTGMFLLNIPAAPVASVFMSGSSITIPSETMFRVIFSGNNQIGG